MDRILLELMAPGNPAMHHDALNGMVMCMRTTIDIGDELLRQAKRRAADEGTPLRAVVEGRALGLRGWGAVTREAGMASVPATFAGAPIAFIAAGLLALAFMGFAGLPVR